MTKKKEGAGGVGRNKEIDNVAVYNHFLDGIERGLSVETAGKAGYMTSDLKQCPDTGTWRYHERYLKPETAKRRFRAIKSDPFGDARRLAPEQSAEEVDEIVRRIYANMKFVGGLSQLPIKIAQPLQLKPGCPKNNRTGRV